jgi:pimeloyl-ACP methyl ester carboxylesterase
MQRRLGPEVRTHQSALIRKDGYADLEAHHAVPRSSSRAGRIGCAASARPNAWRSTCPTPAFEVIEDCGHMAPLEKPHELAALLTGWIEATIPA